MTINNPMALGEGSVSCVLHYITGGYVFGGVFCSYLMPIFAAIPYASSYCMEENDQFVAYKIVRSGKNHIVLQNIDDICRWGTSHVAGGVALCHCIVYLPATDHAPVYFGISGSSIWISSISKQWSPFPAGSNIPGYVVWGTVG